MRWFFKCIDKDMYFNSHKNIFLRLCSTGRNIFRGDGIFLQGIKEKSITAILRKMLGKVLPTKFNVFL